MKTFGLKVRAFFKKRSNERKPVSFDKAKTIGVLIYNPDFSQNAFINSFIKKLTSLGKEVEIICYLDKEVNRLYEFPYIELRSVDIDMTGGFKQEKINKFIKTRFDYLYSINISPFLPFESILSRSESLIRIGKYFKGSEKNLEIMIDLTDKAQLHDLIKKMNELIPNLSFHD